MPPAALKPPAVSPYVLLTLTPLFWACNWVIGRAFASEIPPMALTFYRWLFAAAMLAPFAWRRTRAAWPQVRAHWRLLACLGVLACTIQNGLAYLGLNFTTATNGVILNSFIPVLIVVFGFLFAGDRLTRVQALGVLVSLAGVLTILAEGAWSTLARFRFNVGDILIVVSMSTWAIYTLALRRRPAGVDGLAFLFVLAVAGALGTLPLYIVETLAWRPLTWSFEHAIVLVSVALFSSVLAYWFWNEGVDRVGANVAGLFVHLMPVFGVILAWLFLGERLAWYHFAGAALIVGGIWLTSRGAPVSA
ncbi:MAG: DMT family transporter [Proteobacteria bacterium]|nr:DMT family transporter [Pseudomonadota bacterium]